MAWVWGGDGWESSYPYGHTGPVLSVATGTLGIQRAIVSGSQDGTIVLWHLGMLADCACEIEHQQSLVQAWKPSRGEGKSSRPSITWIRAVSLVDITQRPFVLACGLGGRVYFIDAVSGEHAGKPLHYGDYLWCAATGELNDTPILVTGGTMNLDTSRSGELQAWDLVAREPIGPPMHHSGTVRGVALIKVDNRTVAVSKDDLGTLRFWDVEDSYLLREREDYNLMSSNSPIATSEYHGTRSLLTALGNFSLAVLDFNSLELIEEIYIGSEILSITVVGKYIIVGCVRGVAALEWGAHAGSVR